MRNWLTEFEPASEKNETQVALNLVAPLRRWRLLNAALLFLAGHRPLAFGAGQGLYLFAPLAALVGLQGVAELATLLSQADGAARLEKELRKAELRSAECGMRSAE